MSRRRLTFRWSERQVEARRRELSSLVERSRDALVLAAITGVVVGAVIRGFEATVDLVADAVGELDLWLLALAPSVGLAVTAVVLRTVGNGTSPATTDVYLEAYHDRNVSLEIRAGVARLAGAVATLGTGGALGMEGPSAYTGATIGATVQRALPARLRGRDHRTLMVAGAAAGVAAISDATPLFRATGVQDITAVDLVGAVGIGVVCAVAARGFAKLLRIAKAANVHPAPARVIGAGTGLAGLLLLSRALTDQNLSLGTGYEILTGWLADPDLGFWLIVAVFFIRCLATTLTVAGGGVGGVFIPLVVGGALVGRAVGDLVHPERAGVYTVLGVAALLGAGYRVPLAAVMFVAETTGRPDFVVPGIIAAVVAELVMGEQSVTQFQRGIGIG